jgi:hypothetical protein
MSDSDFGDPNQAIHIPARDLTGTLEAKLAALDMLLAQLQMVRLVLCGQPVRLDGYLRLAGERPANRFRLWPWAIGRLRTVRSSFAHRAAEMRGQRS